MKKYKIFIFPAICILIVVITFIMIFDLRKKSEEYNYNVNEIEVNADNEENIIEDEQVNEVENEVVENINKTSNENVTSSTESNAEDKKENKLTSAEVYEQNGDTGSTDKKQEAINLVKQKWGEDDTVTFRCDSVTGEGKYIIAVISKKTATVKNYFKVDLEKRTAEVHY